MREVEKIAQLMETTGNMEKNFVCESTRAVSSNVAELIFFPTLIWRFGSHPHIHGWLTGYRSFMSV